MNETPITQTSDYPSKPASQTRIEQCEMAMARKRLSYDPNALIELVANHYASLATVAMALKQIAEHKQYSVEYKSLDELSLHYLRLIYEDHKRQFGVEPSWMEWIRLGSTRGVLRERSGTQD